MNLKLVGLAQNNIVKKLIALLLVVVLTMFDFMLLGFEIVSYAADTLEVGTATNNKNVTFDNYSFAWTAGNLGTATLNSFIVCVIALILGLLVGSMAAFGISRLHWKGSKLAMTYFLTGMMIPIHCVLIPLFTRFAKITQFMNNLGFENFHLTNSLTSLVLPYLTFSLPITIFIMEGFFSSMPNELIECACMEGANIFQIFFKICLPLGRTGLFVTGLMTFVGNWNELLLAMVFISDDAKKTLPVSLSKFVGPYNTNYSQMFAAIMIAVIPTIIVYCAFSNKIVDGLTAGAVKG